MDCSQVSKIEEPHQAKIDRKRIPHAKLVEKAKLLALRYGARKASQILGLNYSTVRGWSWRYGWQIPREVAESERQQPTLNTPQQIDVSPAEILRETLLANKSRSSLALSSYLASTSEQIDRAEDSTKVSLTRRAKDLGDLHGRLFPPEVKQNQILNIAIVTGQRPLKPALSIEAESES